MNNAGRTDSGSASVHGKVRKSLHDHISDCVTPMLSGRVKFDSIVHKRDQVEVLTNLGFKRAIMQLILGDVNLHGSRYASGKNAGSLSSTFFLFREVQTSCYGLAMIMGAAFRQTKKGALLHLRALGFNPGVVIDVGVQRGTPELYEVFPDSLHVLVEPVAEQEPFLKEICSKLRNATYVIAAAAEECGSGTLRVTRNHQYSGVVPDTTHEVSETHSTRQINKVSLDYLAQEGKMPAPILIKIDVDGSEISVLKGSVWLLREKKAQCVIIESTIFGQIHEVINFMTAHDFVLYDILDHLYRPLDNALWQVDLSFVPKDSALLQQTAFAEASRLSELYSADIHS